MGYSTKELIMADQKISQFNSITTPDAADEYAIVDVSVSETKKITQANLETSIATGSTFITAFNSNTSVQPLTTKGDIYTRSTVPTRLPVGTNGQLLSADSAEATGLKWIDAPAGGGGGGGLSQLAESFTFSDFTDQGAGQGGVIFTGSLPEDAVIVGVVFDVTSAFDFSVNSITVAESLGGTRLSGVSTPNDVGTFTTTPTERNFDFTASPNPIVYGSSIPTQGAMTVTILYSTTEASGVSKLVPLPVMPIEAGDTVQLATNTTMLTAAFVIPLEITATEIVISVNSVNTAGTVGLALYSEDGATKLIDVTTASITTSGFKTTAVTPVTLSPGLYYVGIHTNGTADIVIAKYNCSLSVSMNDTGAGNIFAGTLTITASTTPATIDPTAITPNLDNVLMFALNA